MKIHFFASLKSLKKGIGFGSVSQRYGSADPDPHQTVTDPQNIKVCRARSNRDRQYCTVPSKCRFGRYRYRIYTR
jgi:hypothetical protein